MYRTFKSAVAVACIATTLGQTVAFAATSGASAPMASKGAVQAQTEAQLKNKLIRQELIELGAAKDSGMPLDLAFTNLAVHLNVNGVTVEDIKGFVRSEASPEAYVQFETSLQEIHPENVKNMAPADFAAVLTAGLKSVEGKFNSTGLTWSGCTGVAVGIGLAVVAIVTGIIALGKSKSEAAVRASYSSDRALITNQYNSDVNGVETKVATLNSDIAGLQAQKAQNAQQASYLEGKASGELAINPTQAQADLAKAQALRDAATGIDASITQDQQAVAFWSDPANLQNALDNLTTQYNTDMGNSMTAEANRVALVPEYQKQAVIYGIVAGSSLAGGVYFIIDGSASCN